MQKKKKREKLRKNSFFVRLFHLKMLQEMGSVNKRMVVIGSQCVDKQS